MASAAQAAMFRVREMHSADVPACVSVLRRKTPHEGYEPTLVEEIWPKLLYSRRVKAAVVEDARSEIVAFGASAFLTETFVQRLNHNPKPLVARQIMAAMHTESPAICAVDQIAQANAGSGNTVFILHSGLSDVTEPPQECYVAKAQLLSSFLDLHRGYNVSNFMVEAFGHEEKAIYEETSLRVLNDYSAFSGWDSLPVPPGSRRPFLMGLSRHETLMMRTHVLLPLFVYRHPECSFTASERGLLIEALKGHTDEELAALLNVSLSAVKKQWIRVFEKAEAAIGDAAFAAGRSGEQQGRGAQRRHLLLGVIRHRPEELTPYPRSRASDATAGR